MVSIDEKKFRAKQLLEWIWKRNAGSFEKMDNLPKILREKLAASGSLFSGEILARADASDGCVKLLLNFPDGGQAECVLIPAEDRATACLSTQVGCAMQCAFCASGADGLVRNLTAGEIIEQFLQLKRLSDVPITNVVLMGMGEPMANLESVFPAIRAIHDPDRGNISARRITVSTVGVVPGIRRLADFELPVTLAISLHAPDDALRRELIPAAERTPIDEILTAAKEFFASHGREVTFEYTLLAGVNDSLQCAESLARLLRPLRCNVNLIRYNPHPGSSYARPDSQTVADFAQVLRDGGLNVSVRRSRGQDAQAACGQLRQRENNSE